MPCTCIEKKPFLKLHEDSASTAAELPFLNEYISHLCLLYRSIPTIVAKSFSSLKSFKNQQIP